MQGEFHTEHGIHRFEVGRQGHAVCWLYEASCKLHKGTGEDTWVLLILW